MIPLLSFALCAAVTAHPHDPPIVERAEARTMQPAPEITYGPGPELQPGEVLRAWLEDQGVRTPKPMLRLPVVLAFEQGQVMGATSAWIGVLPQAPEDAVMLRIDDSALGISLQERVREHCAPEADSCALWLDGTWGSLLPLLLPPVMGEIPTFAVRSVKGPVAPGDEVRVFVQE